ncbi:AcrR family transcriptional regulator [Actimicrobium sp. GrIS 1.19]|uniref:CerR family C-terminal domain-containing protein n=1 Tax=Actimicrobium sp. GrIS 1.19 TaxID=3071708 RepID=UPI002E058517|nr:AcrR family transcriptional regulator [Actimicrobium sp. GrIS 1.19]
MTALPTTVSTSRRARPDGIETRGHLLIAALRLFAEKGYTKTSTREIARVAGANIGAISYYFGDKAGLYRAVFTEPLGSPKDDIALYDQPDFTLRQSLQGLFSSMLAPLLQGDLMQQCVRLHFREMVEPTGIWAEEIDNGIVPAHSALVRVLCRHLGVTRADDDLHRLAFSVVGLALHIFVARDVIEAIRPKLLATPAAIEQWTAAMVDFADAMVAREADRRRTTVSLKKKKP